MRWIGCSFVVCQDGGGQRRGDGEAEECDTRSDLPVPPLGALATLLTQTG